MLRHDLYGGISLLRRAGRSGAKGLEQRPEVPGLGWNRNPRMGCQNHTKQGRPGPARSDDKEGSTVRSITHATPFFAGEHSDQSHDVGQLARIEEGGVDVYQTIKVSSDGRWRLVGPTARVCYPDWG
jgi:hypothetical protein